MEALWLLFLRDMAGSKRSPFLLQSLVAIPEATRSVKLQEAPEGTGKASPGRGVI